MKIESPAFTIADVRSFMDGYVERERDILADRLQRASERLAALGARIQAQRGGGEGEWNPHELLAHIAVLSKFYGVLVHRVSTGQLPNMNLLEAVHLRDPTGEQMAQLEPEELVRMALADHQRTIKALRAADPAALRRSAKFDDDITMTAEEIARLPLISHLELHIDELERKLEGASAQAGK